MKSSKDADGRQAVLLMLSDRKQREYFSTGFTASQKEFDTSKQGGRFHQGRGVTSFNVKRKEPDGKTKVYTNKEANGVLANLEKRASDILKGYEEKHINWGMEQFRSDFINKPKRELFLSYAKPFSRNTRTVGSTRVPRLPMKPSVLWSVMTVNLTQRPFRTSM